MMPTLKARARRCSPSRTVTAYTGTHCPDSGRWLPDGDRHNGRVFFEGSLMPSFAGAPVIWVLETAADRT